LTCLFTFPRVNEAAPAVSADSLSVSDCVALARAVAPEVRARGLDREAARFDSLAASTAGGLNWSVFGGATVAPPNFYDPAATNLGEYELKGGLELSLYDGGRNARTRARGALVSRAAGIESVRGARDAGLRAAEVALDVLSAREQAGGLRETLEWLSRLGSLVGSGLRAGSRDRADADRVALERDAVQSDLSQLELSRGTLARELAALLGRPAGERIEPRDPDADAEAAPTERDSTELLARAERSPEVLAGRLAQQRQRLELEEARRRNAVDVTLAADAGLWGTDLTRAVPPDLAASHPGATFSDRLRRDMGASLGVRFQRAVHDPFTPPTVRARDQDVRAADTRAAAASAERTRVALDLLERWRNAQERLALANASTARAEQHLLRLRSLYAAGASTLLELLDARRQLDDARGRRADARRDTRLARWERELM
jgi:outer membrane protein TolC